MYPHDQHKDAYRRCLKRKPEGHESHKQIEKRRRDRINQSLMELSQAIPAAFTKQSSRRLEKAEILEMTVQYIRAIENTEIATRFDKGDWYSSDIWADFLHLHQSGYSECMRELCEYYHSVQDPPGGEDHITRLVSYLQSRYRPEGAVNAAFQRSTHINDVKTMDNNPRSIMDRSMDHDRRPGPLMDQAQTADDSRRPRLINALTRHLGETVTNSAFKRCHDETNITASAINRQINEPHVANNATFRNMDVPQARRCLLNEDSSMWPISVPKPELTNYFRF